MSAAGRSVSGMATWADVRQVASALPETVEETGRDGLRAFRVRGRMLIWERPLRRADLAALGDAAPSGPIACVWVPDLGAKEALLADDPSVFFTTPHFDGYSAVLLRLPRLGRPELKELVTEAWFARAPKRLAKAYLEERDGRA